jgi:hypothetical protein
MLEEMMEKFKMGMVEGCHGDCRSHSLSLFFSPWILSLGATPHDEKIGEVMGWFE